MNRQFPFLLTLAAVIAGVPRLSTATEIQVEVIGFEGNSGQIGCALHSSGDTFPMAPEGVPTIWVSPRSNKAICVFKDVADGTYAIAVSHDLNGNQKTDTNFIGLPTESWGVSLNIRPTMRPPRFEEAAFPVAETPVMLTVEID